MYVGCRMEPLFIISTFNMIVVSSNSRHDSGVSKQDRSRLEIRKLTAVQYSTVQYSTLQYRVRKCEIREGAAAQRIHSPLHCQTIHRIMCGYNNFPQLVTVHEFDNEIFYCLQFQINVNSPVLLIVDQRRAPNFLSHFFSHSLKIIT